MSHRSRFAWLGVFVFVGGFFSILYSYSSVIPWWRHQMETFSALLALCTGIHRSPVNIPHKGQWCGALMFSFICVWINGWVNNRETGDLRRYRAHYDVIIMYCNYNTLLVEWSFGDPCLAPFNTLRPRPNDRHFSDDIFKCIFLNKNISISIRILLTFAPKVPIDNKTSVGLDDRWVPGRQAII